MLKVDIPVISLYRDVNYWQVEESKEEKTVKDVYGKDSTIVKYNYDAKWVKKPIVKDGGYRALFTLPTAAFTATDVYLGPYRVSKKLTSRITKEPLDQVDIPFENFLDAAGVTDMNRRFISKSGVTMHRSGNTYHFGKDFANPEVGDVQVSFIGVKPGTYSAIALVDEDGSLTTEDRDGKTVTEIVKGKRSAKAMMGRFVRRQKDGIWKLRLGLMLLFSMLLIVLLKDEKYFILKCVSLGVLAVMAVISPIWLFLRFKVGIFLFLFTLLLAVYAFWLFHPKKPTVVIEDGGKPETIDLSDGDGKTDKPEGDGGTGGSSIRVTDKEDPEVFSLE